MRPLILLLIAVLAIGGAVVLPASAAHAATFTVTSLADTTDGVCDAHCTLREAIAAANATPDADVITFSVDGTISLTADLPDVINPLTLMGNGIGATIIDGMGFRPLFLVLGTGDVTVRQLHARNGLKAEGGLISTRTTGTLTLDGVMLSDGSAPYGGAINADQGRVVVRNSVLADNVSYVLGAALYSAPGTTVTIENSLVTGNDGNGATLEANGALEILQTTVSRNVTDPYVVYAAGGLLMRNSVISGNFSLFDCVVTTATVTSSLIEDGGCGITAGVSGNLVGVAGLDAGFRPTASSRLVNAGVNASVPAGISVDLDGAPRIRRGTVDMGAYEAGLPFAVSVTAVGASAAEGSGGALTFRFTRDLVDVDPLTVNFSVTGTASASDVTPAPGTTIVIPGGATTADLVLTPARDALAEVDETVIVTLVAGADYTPTAPLTATATILNGPPPPVPPAAVAALPPTGGTSGEGALAGIAVLALGLLLTVRARRATTR